MPPRKRPETTLDTMRRDRAVKEAEFERAEGERELERARLDALYAEVFDTPRGQELLAYLRKHTIDKRLPHDISDGALRGWEYVRNFVHDFYAAIARHRERAAQR